MKVRRLILGVIAVVMLVTSLVLFFSSSNEGMAYLTGVTGIFSRVGIVLFTLYLAWPVLEKHADRIPMFLGGTLLAGLLFLAIRPQMGRIIVVLILALLVIHFGLRFASSRLGGVRRK